MNICNGTKENKENHLFRIPQKTPHTSERQVNKKKNKRTQQKIAKKKKILLQFFTFKLAILICIL